MKSILKPLLLLIATCCSLGVLYAQDSVGAKKVKLTVVVENVDDDSGEVLIGAYDKPTKTFELYERYIGGAVKAHKGSVSIVFEVPVGKYVIVSIHDQNSNRFLDQNFLGLPSEPYAISNEIRVPNWKKSLLDVDKDMTFKLKLK